jgi:hypothetical protein
MSRPVAVCMVPVGERRSLFWRGISRTIPFSFHVILSRVFASAQVRDTGTCTAETCMGPYGLIERTLGHTHCKSPYPVVFGTTLLYSGLWSSIFFHRVQSRPFERFTGATLNADSAFFVNGGKKFRVQHVISVCLHVVVEWEWRICLSRFGVVFSF